MAATFAWLPAAAAAAADIGTRFLSAAAVLRVPTSLTAVFQIDVLLMAVPKSRTTHSKKRMRMANKGLKNLLNIRPCIVCGECHLEHQMCPRCLATIEANRPTVMRKPTGL